MTLSKSTKNLAVAVVVLAALVLACGNLKKMSSNETEEANKLVKSASEDLAEVDRIAEENDDKSSELDRAENARDADEVKRILNESIEAIDKGLEHGNSAVDKLTRASKMNVDSVFKEYLTLKAQAFQKQIDAFNSLKEAAEIMRDNYGKGGDTESKAKKDFRQKRDNYKKLLAESKDIHRKADSIARQNPDKIKT